MIYHLLCFPPLQHFQHTYIHAYIHTYMQACKHAFIHTYMHACVHAYMHACLHTYIHAYMHSYTHTYMLACMHAYIHALVCNHGSAYFSSLPWMFIYFFHFQDWFSSVFFFRSLSHQLSSLCHCFSLFMFIHFHVVVTCYPLGIVFTWPLFWYMLSSMLVICNCFIFRFHHISYIYSCPSPSILFQRDPKKPSRRSSNLQNPYINFDTTNAILHKKLQWVQEIMYAMHAVCLISCLRLATEQHCILPQKGVNGKVYLIIHELKTHSGWSRRGTAQGGERVWWVGFLTISEYFIKYIYIYTYTKSYKNISSYIDITYIYRDHDQSLQHTRQTNTDTHPHKHTKKKEKNERANKCPCSRPPCKYMTVIIYNIYMYIHMSNQTLNCDIGYLNHLCKKTMNAIHTVCFS